MDALVWVSCSIDLKGFCCERFIIVYVDIHTQYAELKKEKERENSKCCRFLLSSQGWYAHLQIGYDQNIMIGLFQRDSLVA
jgi:hypothetical protein